MIDFQKARATRLRGRAGALGLDLLSGPDGEFRLYCPDLRTYLGPGAATSRRAGLTYDDAERIVAAREARIRPV